MRNRHHSLSNTWDSPIHGRKEFLPTNLLTGPLCKLASPLFLNMNTTLAKPGQVEQKWYVVDAADQVLGRLAVQISNVLRGRHKPTYTPHVDTGDFVIVINADKVRLTGKKDEKKQYMFYTGWVGNERYRNVEYFREKNPAFIIEHAVKGMLPKNRLARQMAKKLKVYAGNEHPHEAQNPIPFKG